MQLEIEKEVGVLMLLREEREREGTAGRRTRNLLQRINTRRRKIRGLLCTWQAWLAFMQPSSYEPEEVDDDDMFAGNLPWEPSSMAATPSERAAQLAWTRATAELARTVEELNFLRSDPGSLDAYYAWQEESLLKFVLGERGRGKLTEGLVFVVNAKLVQIRGLRQYAKETFARIGLSKC